MRTTYAQPAPRGYREVDDLLGLPRPLLRQIVADLEETVDVLLCAQPCCPSRAVYFDQELARAKHYRRSALRALAHSRGTR